jgi:hypothetical protein
MFREAFQEFCPESNTSNPNLQFHFINMSFGIIFKSVWVTIFSTVTRIPTERSEVQILAEARELSLLQNIQTSSSTYPASNPMKTTSFSLAVKWPGQTV